MHECDRRTMRARATEAVTRIRIRRASIDRHTLIEFLGMAIFFAPAGAVVAGLVITQRLGMLSFESIPSYALVTLLMGLLFLIVAAVVVIFFIVVIPYIIYAAIEEFLWPRAIAAVALLGLAWLIARALPSAFRSRSLRRQAEEILVREGELPADWVEGDLHRRVRDRLASQDEDLCVTEEGGLAPRVDTTPPESCPRCAAPLSIPGVGLRRCEYCGFERYDDLPDPGMALRTAREIFLAAKEEGTSGGEAAPDARPAPPPSPGILLPVRRRELWRVLVESLGGKMRRRRRRVLVYVGVLVAIGVLMDVAVAIYGDAVSHLAALPFGVAGVVAFVCAFEVPLLTLQYYDLRFSQFQRGAREYDTALLGEIVRAVAYKGRATKEEIATHLGIRRRDLEEVLASVTRYGGAPVYHDRVHDQLIGLQAFHAGSNRCLACGGVLEVERRGRIKCGHCGSEALSLMATAA
jgi:hypothetical protein